MPLFKAACIQLRSSCSVSCNVEGASALIREAAGKGASYIQTPEMTHLVARRRDDLMREVKLEADDEGVAQFSKLAAELKITLHIGSLAILRDCLLYTSPSPRD